MSLDKPTPDAIDGAELRFALVAAGYNGELVQALKKNAVKGLRAAGVPAASIVEVAVPGSGEIPYAAYMSAMTGDYDCVIALGVVVAGDTPTTRSSRTRRPRPSRTRPSAPKSR